MTNTQLNEREQLRKEIAREIFKTLHDERAVDFAFETYESAFKAHGFRFAQTTLAGQCVKAADIAMKFINRAASSANSNAA